MKKRTFFGQVYARLVSDTPSFFQKIKIFGASLTALATGLTTIHGVPAKITSVTGDLIWVGAVMTLVASLVVKNGDAVTYKEPSKDSSDTNKVVNAVQAQDAGINKQ